MPDRRKERRFVVDSSHPLSRAMRALAANGNGTYPIKRVPIMYMVCLSQGMHDEGEIWW